MKVLLALALTLGLASATCPGETICSGHGTCSSNDKCVCYRNWDNVDCGDRKCPHKISWADIDDGTANREPHYYAECSGKGVCDVTTGQCLCYDGFTGAGCDRMKCPGTAGGCSGHGTCETMESANSGYSLWDAKKMQVCQCDAGWEGPACSDRKCPKGDDPLTQYTSGSLSVDEVQLLTFAQASGALACAAGDYALTFTDVNGETWTTFAISTLETSIYTIKEALEAIPNAAIPSVTVEEVSGSLSNTPCDLVMKITFTDPANSGDQPQIGVVTTPCIAAGCQPVVVGLGGQDTITPSTLTPGTKENAICSNRGRCDRTTGSCVCQDGYTGESCDQLTILT